MKRVLYLFLLVSLLAGNVGAAVDPGGIVDIAPRYASDAIPTGSGFQVALEVTVAEGWHINTNAPSYEFAIPTEIVFEDTPGIKISETVFPPASGRLDIPGGGNTPIFSGTFYIIVRGRAAEGLEPGVYPLDGLFSFQGCNDETCLRPAEKEFAFRLNVVPEGTVVGGLNRDIFSPVGGRADADASSRGAFAGARPGDRISDMVQERGLVVTLLLVFVGGLALNLTPCVYPLIPITISYFGGRQGAGNPVPGAVAYVLGICLMYSTLGTAAAVTGKMFGALLTNPVVLIALAGFMVALALSMFGLFDLRLPTALMNIGGSARTGVLGALFMGLTMGIVAAPCVGPFVIGLLTYVATLGSPAKGFILFFFLSLGLGTPYLFLGIFSGRISSLPRAGEWMVGVRRIFGVVLVAMAVYFLNPVLGATAYPVVMGLALVAGGAFLAVFDRSGKDGRAFHTFKGIVAVVLIVGGTWLLKPAARVAELPWVPFSQTALEEAGAAGKPVVIDFFADWCIPCRELDEVTFTDAAVLAFSSEFVFLKADLSVEEGEEVTGLKETYAIQGVPTIVFLEPGGTEYEDLRLTGFEKPALFVRRLETLRSRAAGSR